MIALIGAELMRALSRRLIRVLAILAVLNFVVAGVLVFALTDSDDEVASKRAAIADARAQCDEGTLYPPGSPAPFGEGIVFEPGPGAPGGPVEPTAPGVDTPERDRMCRFIEEQDLGSIRQLDLSSLIDVTRAITSLMTIVAILIGASLIGAEWAAKTVAVHLTWEPRRVHAFLSKVAAAIVIASAFYVFTQLLEIASLYPSAALHGSTDVADGFWGDLLGVIGRGTVASAVCAALGFAIASVTTSTVFALGFTFLINILDGLVGAVVWRGYTRWSLFRNLGGYVSGEGVPEVAVNFREVIPGRSPGGAGIVIVVYAIVLIAAGTQIFRRRDIA